ncbi:hypothetical protein BC829DRAFT_215151 [Chytridium lagenaria]|nr:hypothetical protein BC829DRAFT_215151 [Chytridium lagenaria]
MDIATNITGSAENGTTVEGGLGEIEESGGENLWFTNISIQFITGMNSISLILAVFALILFVICRVYNKKFFERLSLRIITCLLVCACGFHIAFIYSLYYADTLNCQISTFLYCFFSLVHCFLTTGLGCNLFIIFVLKHQVKDSMFWAYWTVAIVVGISCALPPMFMNIIYYDEVDGCWFKNVRYSWGFYYGPLFFMAAVNIILGIAVQFALLAHRREMTILGKDVEDSSKGESHTNDGSTNHNKSSSIGIAESGRSASQLSSPTVHNKSQLNLAPKKMRRTGDELSSIAIIVNLYVAIPFICEFATAVTESIPDMAARLATSFKPSSCPVWAFHLHRYLLR